MSKKTCQLIIEGGNDYVIAVKGNQKNLYRQLRLKTENARGHWGIENRLHWVKDVVFDEDRSTIHTGQAPANLSLLRAISYHVRQ